MKCTANAVEMVLKVLWHNMPPNTKSLLGSIRKLCVVGMLICFNRAGPCAILALVFKTLCYLVRRVYPAHRHR